MQSWVHHTPWLLSSSSTQSSLVHTRHLKNCPLPPFSTPSLPAHQTIFLMWLTGMIALVCFLIKYLYVNILCIYREYLCKWYCVIDFTLFLTILIQHCFTSCPRDCGTRCFLLFTASLIPSQSRSPWSLQLPLPQVTPKQATSCVVHLCEKSSRVYFQIANIFF